MRKGMALRKKHLELLNINPKMLKKVVGGYYVGLDKPLSYNIDKFKQGSPKLYEIFKHKPKATIPASVVNNLSDEEIKNGFESGYLKFDSRGYYFTDNILALMEVIE